jgi:Putative Ig domain
MNGLRVAGRRLPGRKQALWAAACVLGAAGLAGLAASPAAAQAAGPACPAAVITGNLATVTCGYTGAAQSWTVPQGVTQATFTLYGAEGGASSTGESGGLGAEVTASLAVSPGSVFQVNVGQGGGTNDQASPFNGGGPGGAGGGVASGGGGDGGGGTDIRSPAPDGSYPVTSDVLAAGGGGGGGLAGEAASGGGGGNADSAGGTGGTGASILAGGGGGGAGTATMPGAAGGGGCVVGLPGVDCGSSGASGGTGASQGTGGGGAPGGGGGGGGFNGGGGGGEGGINFIGFTPLGGNGGGGGGASYAADVPGATVTDGVAAPDDAPNGEVIITYEVPLAVITTSLPGATLGSAYSAALAATGGTPPYIWSVSGGSLPPGLSLDATTGVISGTPVLAGTFGFTVMATDSTSPTPQTATANLAITVGGCTTTITGTHNGPLTIGSGVTCLDQATVSGPVKITAGAVVSVAGSQLRGPLSASGPASLAVCGSTVSGPASVSGATGLVLFGGTSGSPCGTDTVAGPATLTGNTGGVILAGNTVSGPASITSNSGGTLVGGNTIDGPLSCSGNNPAPTDGGQPNTVSGPATGQCSALA